MFRKIDIRRYDILHYHGDDYLCRGSVRRVRTFYGSALYEARFAAKPLRFAYQALFYVFELVSCMRKGEKIGISRATAAVLPGVHRVIACGVPLDAFKPGDKKTVHPTLLFIGDLDSRKRGRFLVDLFVRRILPAFPEATLTIIGPQACNAPGVIFVGNCSEAAMIDEYQKAWIYCSVSSYEGFGVPLVEAMACATAVAATRNAGALEIITHGRDGMLCVDEELPHTLMQLLSDSALRRRLSDNGLQTVKKYGMETIALGYARIYRACGVGEKTL
jgi:glycosyltransferase involved in cell wall biosynthesis